METGRIRYELWWGVEDMPFDAQSLNWYMAYSSDTAEEAIENLKFEKEMDERRGAKYIYVVRWVEEIRKEGFVYSEVTE